MVGAMTHRLKLLRTTVSEPWSRDHVISKHMNSDFKKRYMIAVGRKREQSFRQRVHFNGNSN